MLIGGNRRRVMWYPDVKLSDFEQEQQGGGRSLDRLSDFERERFERHADFLVDQSQRDRHPVGYIAGKWPALPKYLRVRVRQRLRI
jgi:hypothetical protein